MDKIFIGVCSNRNFRPFWDSLEKFRNSICEYYDVKIMIVNNEFLADAQNKISESFMESGYDYLLFLDDDHWGHTKEMLDCLIGADSLVATIKTYSRHYPYSCALMRKLNEDGLYVGVENGRGYEKVDMCGFPMTLIKRQLFYLLDTPYFTSVTALDRNWHTDLPFYKKLSVFGIKPTGCFQHCLNHDIITQYNVMRLRHEEIRDRNKKAMLDSLYIKHNELLKREGLCTERP